MSSWKVRYDDLCEEIQNNVMAIVLDDHDWDHTIMFQSIVGIDRCLRDIEVLFETADTVPKNVLDPLYADIKMKDTYIDSLKKRIDFLEPYYDYLKKNGVELEVTKCAQEDTPETTLD